MMDCACFDADVSEFSRMISEGTLTAKKKHRCYECLKDIEPGELYHREVTVSNKEINTYRLCVDCYSVRTHLICSWYYGEVWDLVEESINEDSDNLPWSKIAKLTPAAREKVCEIIEEAWEEEDED